MKSAVLLSSILLSAVIARAATEESPLPIRTSNEIEASCRIKAKEVAAETYRGCVTEQKNSQIEQIKKEYAAKLQALKAHYEQELKKMNSKAKAEEAPAEAAPIEKVDSAAVKASGKKSKSSAALVPKKSNKKPAVVVSPAPTPVPVVSKAEVTEMTVQLKQAPATPVNDE